MRRLVFGWLWLAVLVWPAQAAAQAAPIDYRVTFPEPEHHWMQVEMTVSGLGGTPLRARMSRSSPGRYAVHEFAKNIFWFEAFDGSGRPLTYSRPGVDEWRVAGHDGTVRVVYRIFGDQIDGTYLGVDTSHAHINMPAAFLWAAGLETRAMRVTFVAPAGSNWRVATQLFPTTDPFTFTAPNLQYFMDSPTEVSDFLLSTFTVKDAGGREAVFRLAAHAVGEQGDLDQLAAMVERLVREELAVFGEFPAFEPGYYTFLLDYVAWADDDGMEHRNSTFISDPGVFLAGANGRLRALDTISHEFFHAWNVERIRPEGLEPFDFTRENITCCLWLAEGFTQYYGELFLTRAGFASAAPLSSIGPVVTGSGRLVRSPVQMSEYAPFADASTSIDPTDRSRSFISYYTYGAAVALALDLSLRERGDPAVTLDDYMRLLWQRFGRTAEGMAGYVGRPYSLEDARDALAELTNDRVFADSFFLRYIEGRDVADYASLLAPAGYRLQLRRPDAGWVGQFALEQAAGGLLISSLVPFGTPAYEAGLDLGDVITAIDGRPATSADWNDLRLRRPGDPVSVTIRRMTGIVLERTLTVRADPSLRVEDLGGGGALTPEQSAFRAAWLGARAKD
jgi:predicted metalloprotease with PDZ domain